MSLILALPFLDFSIGPYNFNVYTYPAWTSLVLQTISWALNSFLLRPVENKAQHIPHKEGKQKNIYISTGVILIFLIFFYDGYLIGTFSYALPIVMLEGYGW